MQITHQEARRFIQIELDGRLSTAQKSRLDSHLETCADCRNYMSGMKSMELTLRPLLQRQWNQQPIPLSIAVLYPKMQPRIPKSMLLATRIAAIGIMFVAFLFSAWQLSVSDLSGSAPVLTHGPAMPPVSFTSTQRTTATTHTEHCTETVYVVQENDTLDSIAGQFSIGKDELLRSNNLSSEVIHAGTKLTIKICVFTPTGTVNAIKATYMPLTGQITSTPTGY